MNPMFKVSGLGLLAALAISAFAASSGSADPSQHTGGHFAATGAFPVKLHGHNGTGSPHRFHWTLFGSTVTCTETYSGEINAATVTSIAITPTYTNCGSSAIRMNGCAYILTVRNTSASTLHSPVLLKCPAGKNMEFEFDAGCPYHIGEQTVTNAVAYTTTLVNNRHALTIDFTMTGMTWEKHGWCEFKAPVGTGPHGGFHLIGSLTLSGTDASGNIANITATGTNGH